MTTEDRGAQARFGTLGGVFTPCVLTILGVIMFMRSGEVVGTAGVFGALLILLIAKSITGLTTLSLSAIATNTEVRTGGVYYMISRTLGPDFGGAIGITLFLAQAVSIGFYVIGFSEALFNLFPQSTVDAMAPFRVEQWVSTAMIVVLFFVTFKGADVAIKAQYGILALLLLSVVSFIIGGLMEFDASRLADNWGAATSETMTQVAANAAEAQGLDPPGTVLAPGFWIMFALFFPAATGITAGANMSGDLKDPGKSIPSGTLYAIGFTAIVYVIQLILLGGTTEQETLIGESYESLKVMSIFAPLIVLGVFAATLSSALGSFLGAPRILQAMGIDRLLKPLAYFGKGHGPAAEPRRATVLSLGIAISVVWAGGLNAVAQVISMFFLIAYGMVNLSAFVEGRAGNPSFRPRFKVFGWPAALAGTIGCVIAMVKIDETYALVSMGIAAGVYFYLRGRASGDFGDAKRGYVFSRTRQNLLTLEDMTTDPKNWRPVLAVVTEDYERDRNMLNCASWIESGRGLLSVLEVVSAPDMNMDERLDLGSQRRAKVKQHLHRFHITAFADSVVVPGLDRLETVMQAYSIGALRPNTVMLSVPPPSQIERRERVAAAIKTLSSFGINFVIYKGARMDGVGKQRIDLWWHGQRNGSLLVLFAYLASTHREWSGARIRMLRVVATGEEHLEAERTLTKMMAAARLAVDVDVVLSERPVSELIAERSSASDLVLLGLAQRDVEDFQAFLAARDELLAKLPPTLLILSNGEADLLA